MPLAKAAVARGRLPRNSRDCRGHHGKTSKQLLLIRVSRLACAVMNCSLPEKGIKQVLGVRQARLFEQQAQALMQLSAGTSSPGIADKEKWTSPGTGGDLRGQKQQALGEGPGLQGLHALTFIVRFHVMPCSITESARRSGMSGRCTCNEGWHDAVEKLKRAWRDCHSPA